MTGRDRRYPGRGHDGPALEGRRLGKTVDPALESQPVADQCLRVGDGARVGWLGLIGMSVRVGPHQGRQLDALAAHLHDQVGQDGEGGHDLGLRLGRSGAGGEQKRRREQETTIHVVII